MGAVTLSDPVVDPAVPVAEMGLNAPANIEVSTPQPETDWKAEAEKWKTFSRKNEDAAKANADAAKRLKEIEDRDLSELQRTQRERDETNAELARMRRENVLLAKGISPDLTPPAPDAPAEAFAEYADRLIAWRGAAVPAAPPQPRPDQSQGAQPQSAQAQEDAEYAQFKAHLFPTNQ